MGPARRLGDERGNVTLPYVYGIGLTLLLFVVVANLVVQQYGHGVLRTVADEAARSGARSTGDVTRALTVCRQGAERVHAGLMSERLGLFPQVTCEVQGDRVVVTAEATFPGWLPLIPDWRPAATASTRWEGQR